MQIDFFLGPRDHRFKTFFFFLNRVRLRNWDHFLVVVKIEGQELKVKKGEQSWQGGLLTLKQKDMS